MHHLKRLPARIAFPGCVIFLPPGAAAAKRRFPSHTLWTGVKLLAMTPKHAAGCCWDSHPRLQIASLHGPSETQNGLYRDDIFPSANTNKFSGYNTQQCASCPMRQSQHNHWGTTRWPGGGRLMNIKIRVHTAGTLIGLHVWFDYFMQIFRLLNVIKLWLPMV